MAHDLTSARAPRPRSMTPRKIITARRRGLVDRGGRRWIIFQVAKSSHVKELLNVGRRKDAVVNPEVVERAVHVLVQGGGALGPADQIVGGHAEIGRYGAWI